MKTTVFLFNDRTTEMTVRVQGVDGNSLYYLESRGIMEVPLDIPEDTVPYIKVWETNVVLVSYIDPNWKKAA